MTRGVVGMTLWGSCVGVTLWDWGWPEARTILSPSFVTARNSAALLEPTCTPTMQARLSSGGLS